MRRILPALALLMLISAPAFAAETAAKPPVAPAVATDLTPPGPGPKSENKPAPVAEPAKDMAKESVKEAAPVTETAAPASDIVIGDTLHERVLGEASAPVSIIEYASLTCPHCADFHKTILPQIVDKYVTNGQVKIIYRDFPLDSNALKAAQLAQCMPDDRYFPFIKTLFDTQASWASSEAGNNVDANLTQYAKLAGLPGERITACLANTKLQEALVQRRMEASKQFNIEATPTFIINYGKETINGATSFEDFDKVLKKYVKPVAAKMSEKPVSDKK